MADPFIDFEWLRDPRGGFALRDGTPMRTRMRLLKQTDLEEPGEEVTMIIDDPQRIVWNGDGTLQRYRPLDQCPDIALLFSRVRHENEALRFVNRFGLLTHKGVAAAKRGETVRSILEHAATLRSALSPSEIFKHDDERAHPSFLFQASLVPNPTTGGVRLRLSVTDLLGAIMLKAIQVSEGAALRQCLHCE